MSTRKPKSAGEALASIVKLLEAMAEDERRKVLSGLAGVHGEPLGEEEAKPVRTLS